LVADLHQRLGDVVDVLDVHPAGHSGHGPARAGGREQQDGEELGPEELPVVGVVSLVPWMSAASARMRPIRRASL
jgi:hypothetical protein